MSWTNYAQTKQLQTLCIIYYHFFFFFFNNFRCLDQLVTTVYFISKHMLIIFDHCFTISVHVICHMFMFWIETYKKKKNEKKKVSYPKKKKKKQKHPFDTQAASFLALKPFITLNPNPKRNHKISFHFWEPKPKPKPKEKKDAFFSNPNQQNLHLLILLILFFLKLPSPNSITAPLDLLHVTAPGLMDGQDQRGHHREAEDHSSPRRTPNQPTILHSPSWVPRHRPVILSSVLFA